MRLYHTGLLEIPAPDVHYGRENADFGQGFYLSPDEEFSVRWAKLGRDHAPVLNVYELDAAGLEIREYRRDRAWFDFIFDNRAWRFSKEMPDVIIGPIANDTLYNTLGVLTSGLVDREQALQALCFGPLYTQVVLKSRRAAKQLRFLSSRELSAGEVLAQRERLSREEREFQEHLAAVLGGEE